MKRAVIAGLVVLLSACSDAGDDGFALSGADSFDPDDVPYATIINMPGALRAASLVASNFLRDQMADAPYDSLSRPHYSGSPCSSGDYQFTPDAATPFVKDGAVTADDCVANDSTSGQGDIFRDVAFPSRYTGTYVTHCVDEPGAAEQCAEFTVDWGQGGDTPWRYWNLTTITGAVLESTTLLEILGSMQYSAQASDGQSQALYAFSAPSLVFASSRGITTRLQVMQDFESTSSVSPDGLSSVRTVNGTLGVDSNDGTCNIGKVDIETLEPIGFPGRDFATSGRARLTGANGSEVLVVFNPDQTVTVEFNGEQQTRPYSSLRRDCI